ncbi:MAG: MFS transporter [Spirochaetaceae bacterium]|nr:MAG: MFS transporter [Spirochaetaceae bacterium]
MTGRGETGTLPPVSRIPAAYRETALFSLLLWVFWAAIVSVEGFLVPWLLEEGYTSSQAGLVMSAIFLFAIVGQPAWGYACDRLDRHRSLFVLAMASGAGVLLIMPLVANRLLPVLGVAALYSLTINSMPGNLDGWIMARRSRQPGIEYGLVRAMGSAGFALFATVLGRVYDQWGLHLIFPVFAGFAATATVIALITPDSGGGRPTPLMSGDPGRIDPTILEGEGDTARSGNIRETAGLVWNNHRYRVFVLSAVLLFSAFRAAFTFMPMLMTEVGGGYRHLGWTHTIGAGTEIPVMILSGWFLRRIRAQKLILLAMVVFTVRMMIYPFITTPQQLILVQILHGPSFGLFLAASVHYIDSIAPAGSKSLFQALAPSIYFGAGSVAGSAIGGVVVDLLGVRMLYMMIPLQILAATLLFRADSLRLDRRDAGGRRDRV